MTGLIKFAVAFSSGYALARAIEARAAGMPVRMVFQGGFLQLVTPVSRIAELYHAAVAAQPALGPDDLMSPKFAQ